MTKEMRLYAGEITVFSPARLARTVIMVRARLREARRRRRYDDGEGASDGAACERTRAERAHKRK